MLGRMLFAVECAARKTDDFLTRHRLLFCALLSALLSALLAVYNVSSGPLFNLNDIGGWNNRALFIVMTAFVHASMLMFCALFSRVRFSRIALRQVILTAGLFIMLLAINQKAYVYVNVLQPEEFPTAPVKSQIRMLHEPVSNLSFEKFNFDKGVIWDE